MSDRRNFYSIWEPQLLAVFRIVLGFLFLQHGSAKLFGIPHVAMFEGVQWMSVIGLAGMLELCGGAMILLGLFTRPVAFLLSGEIAVAYFIAHASSAWSPILNDGELTVLYCFAFLYLSVAGAGAFSMDAARQVRAASQISRLITLQ